MPGSLLDNLKLCEAHLTRIDRVGGFDHSKLKEIVRNPSDRSVDIYKPVDPRFVEQIDTHIPEYQETDVGYVIYLSDKTTLQRHDVVNFIKNSGKVWICCPPDLSENAKVSFPNAEIIQQYEFIALTPDNKIIDDVYYCCGSADSIISLYLSDSFRDFVTRGGKNVYLIDASLSLCLPDKKMIYKHVEDDSNVTVSVTRANQDDSRAVLCDVEGSPQLLESFLFYRRPLCFDLVHTGHTIFKTDLKFDKIVWNWHRRTIVSRGKADVHYKRYLYDLTEAYSTKFVKVERDVCSINAQQDDTP